MRDVQDWLSHAVLLIAVVGLGACTGGAPPTATPTLPVGTAAPMSPPTATEMPPPASATVAANPTIPSSPMASAPAEPTTGAASPTATSTQVATAGRTAEGYFFRGRADAPVELWDFSDFL